MKKLSLLLFLLGMLLSITACFQPQQPAETANQELSTASAQHDNSALFDAYKNKKSDIFVEGSGVVKKLLADDTKGSRHQKFLVTVSAEQTLLFAHNIDLAPRVENLQVGDSVTFRGEYVYNPKGGVMHWTHHDPSGRYENSSPQGGNKVGWIKHNGQKYE